jgi:CBS domain containing-hemolysin-like protein
MLRFIIIIVLAIFTLLTISLHKIYTHVPLKELKRRARRGDGFASILYRAASYGLSLSILLWFLIGLGAAGFFVAVVNWTAGWLAVLAALVLLWLGFAYLPNSRISKLNIFIARYITPLLAWLLNVLSPILSRAAVFLHKHSHISVHTGLYEKEDILELIKRQKKQADNRITAEELAIAANGLTFGDYLVREVMTPRRMVKSIAAKETLGPVLMDELHASGFSRFPVYEGKQGNIIGILFLHDLVAAKAGGSASALMDRKLYYVNEDRPLNHVLQAFLKTKHHLFVVVDNFEEMVGVISIEDVLEKIIGTPIVEEFDTYDDLRTVAAINAKKEQDKHTSEDKVIE